VPPYANDWSDAMRESWDAEAPHLKLTVDGFAVTCFGIAIRKANGSTANT